MKYESKGSWIVQACKMFNFQCHTVIVKMQWTLLFNGASGEVGLSASHLQRCLRICLLVWEIFKLSMRGKSKCKKRYKENPHASCESCSYLISSVFISMLYNILTIIHLYVLHISCLVKEVFMHEENLVS